MLSKRATILNPDVLDPKLSGGANQAAWVLVEQVCRVVVRIILTDESARCVRPVGDRAVCMKGLPVRGSVGNRLVYLR